MITIAGRRMSGWIFHAGILAICSVLFLTVPFLLDRGIDLTDEGAYLNSIATPELYPNSLSLYGFFYHPLLTAFSYNIVLLRAVNYAALVILTLVLVVRATSMLGISQLQDTIARIGLRAAFTVSALFFYCIWLPTPSYNSLNLCGALLLSYAMVGIATSDRMHIREILIASIGLSACALTKPTSGAALALLLLVSTFGARPGYVRSVVGTGFLSAILCFVFLLSVRGSPMAIVHSYREGVSLANGLLGGRSIVDIYLWRSLPFPPELLYIVLVCGIAAIAFFVTEFQSKLGRWLVPSRFAIFSALLALGISIQFYSDWWNRPLNWTPALFAIVFAFCQLTRAKTINIRHFRVALLLLMIPFAVGIGSNTGMLRSSAQAAAIWAVASLFVLAMVMDRDILRTYAEQVAIASTIAVAIVIAWAMYFPQRQVAPLWAQQTWMSAHGRDRVLRVDPGMAAYFRDLALSAGSHGFSDGDDIIDLTGTSPVTIYVLGGRALGASYFSGGWPGSEWAVERSLRSVSYRRLARAWVLTRVPASDTVNPNVLRLLGLDFPGSYEPVGHALPPAAAGEQTLWKPKASDGRTQFPAAH